MYLLIGIWLAASDGIAQHCRVHPESGVCFSATNHCADTVWGSSSSSCSCICGPAPAPAPASPTGVFELQGARRPSIFDHQTPYLELVTFTHFALCLFSKRFRSFSFLSHSLVSTSFTATPSSPFTTSIKTPTRPSFTRPTRTSFPEFQVIPVIPIQFIHDEDFCTTTPSVRICRSSSRRCSAGMSSQRRQHTRRTQRSLQDLRQGGYRCPGSDCQPVRLNPIRSPVRIHCHLLWCRFLSR